ncbi:MAG: 4Fe-4S binding protein, partial [Anaerovorax sp.]
KIHIDEDKCVGCGLCASACSQGAIGMVDGKAKLLREDYCDGLGMCLPVCPTGAITFQEVEVAMATLPCGCPGTESKVFHRDPAASQSGLATSVSQSELQATANPLKSQPYEMPSLESKLQQWPVQLKLVPVHAPYFENANLLIAADCSGFAYGNFHNEFMKNRITLIGCPKLDAGDYTEKLTAILSENNIKSVTVVRMEVPCCSGIANATINALKDCGKMIPWQVFTISTKGTLLD